MKILMICDNADLAETFREFFELCGHRCEVAVDRKSVVLQTFLNKFDVVIADLPLPDFDYCNLLAILKNNNAAKVKVFIVTETEFPANTTNILKEIGIAGVFKKPLSIGLLLETML